MKVLLSKGVGAPKGKHFDLTWPELKDLIRYHNTACTDESDDEKRRAPWFSAAEYRNGYRNRANIIGKPWVIVADLDDVRDPDAVKRALGGYEYCAWTTWSSTPGKQRWRIVLPIEGTGVDVKRFPALVDRVLGGINGAAKIDAKSRTAEQLWFLPVHKRSQRANHRIWENHGAWVKPGVASAGGGSVIHVDFTGVVNVHRPESIGRGDRNNSLVRRLTLTDALLCETKSEIEAIAMEWNGRLRDPMERREVLGIVRKTWNWMQRGTGVRKRAEAWKTTQYEVGGSVGVGMLDVVNTGAVMPDSLIGDFLYPGATMLSAKMKEGKSYLAMQMAFSVASGTPFLAGDRHPGFSVNRQAKAVVLALEDTPGGINRRFHGNIASGHLATPGGVRGDNVRTVYLEDLERVRRAAPDRVDGLVIFEKLVQDWYNNGYRLVCIDPLAALAGALRIVDYPGCEGIRNIHTRDFQTMRYFTALAQRFDNLCFVISMHHGKSKSGHNEADPGDMIAGTTGFGAGVITTISLLPIPASLSADDEDNDGETSKRRELYIHGRYTREKRILIEQGKSTGLWSALGKVADEMVTSARMEYFKAIMDLGGDEAAVSAEDIRKATGSRVKVDAIHKVLKRAMVRGAICFDRRVFSKKGPGGGYRLRRVGGDERAAWLTRDGQ